MKYVLGVLGLDVAIVSIAIGIRWLSGKPFERCGEAAAVGVLCTVVWVLLSILLYAEIKDSGPEDPEDLHTL